MSDFFMNQWPEIWAGLRMASSCQDDESYGELWSLRRHAQDNPGQCVYWHQAKTRGAQDYLSETGGCIWFCQDCGRESSPNRPCGCDCQVDDDSLVFHEDSEYTTDDHGLVDDTGDELSPWYDDESW